MMKFLFFDLDDTLLDFQGAERLALSATLEEFGIEPTDRVLARYSAINDAQWKRLERGEITREQVRSLRFTLLFAEFGICCDVAEVNRRYMENLAARPIYLEGAEALLETLSKEYRLYLASNGTAWVQEKRIALCGIGRYFEKIFVSEELGYNKPDPLFFEKAFAQIPDFCKNEAVMIGDSLTSDIKGGKNAGLCTVWFNPKGEENQSEIQPEHTVFSLSEIPPLLKKI